MCTGPSGKPTGRLSCSLRELRESKRAAVNFEETNNSRINTQNYRNKESMASVPTLRVENGRLGFQVMLSYMAKLTVSLSHHHPPPLFYFILFYCWDRAFLTRLSYSARDRVCNGTQQKINIRDERGICMQSKLRNTMSHLNEIVMFLEKKIQHIESDSHTKKNENSWVEWLPWKNLNQQFKSTRLPKRKQH